MPTYGDIILKMQTSIFTFLSQKYQHYRPAFPTYRRYWIHYFRQQYCKSIVNTVDLSPATYKHECKYLSGALLKAIKSIVFKQTNHSKIENLRRTSRDLVA